MDDRAGNGLRPYPGLRQPVCLLAQTKTAVKSIIKQQARRTEEDLRRPDFLT